jgi:RimJ/RimL family protein N-acetyltransferase
MSLMSIVATTPRLNIRTWTQQDAPALLALYSDPEVIRYIPHVQLKDLAHAQAKIDEMSGFDPTLWAVEESGRLIGVCGFRQGEPELGFAFARDTWGKGYATEAARECLRWGTARGMQRVIAKVRQDNAASRRALERLGFVDTGDLDGAWCIYQRNAA